MICSNKGCSNEFQKTTHNQKYCSDSCCRDATNKKNKQKYYDEKQRLSGKKRKCSARGCDNLLSRYNSSSICSLCIAKNEENKKSELLRIMNVNC